MEIKAGQINSNKIGHEWVEEEFEKINLGDQRLNKRFFKLATLLSAKHEEPINQACEDWSSTKAAYRFFDNEKAKKEEILRAHQLSTQKRMKKHPYVLSIHDTTYLNYTNHDSKEGLGSIGKGSNKELRGLVVHGSLIITPEGLPLGRLTQKIWARNLEGNIHTRKYKQQKIEEKESYKWVETLRETIKICPEGVEVINICDRESDIYEFFLEANQLETYMLIRANQDRQLLDEDEEKLWEQMEISPLKKKMKIEVPAKIKQAARVADVELRFEGVEIKRPKRAGKDVDKSIFLTAIWLKEPKPPEQSEGIRWMLLTNLPVEDSGEALICIKWYQMRWQIESYHKIWKTGCRIEDCRLETADRLMRYLTLMSIVAWRIFWMTHINRVNGSSPCTQILAEHEWKCLYCKIHKTTIVPSEIPSTNQAVRWIAQLGGFLARKNDGEPGFITIWRGWQRLADIAEVWVILNSPPTCG